MLRCISFGTRKGAIVGLMAAVAAMSVVTAPATPAAAQGLFEFLFGGLRRPPPPPVDFGRQDDVFRSLFRGPGRETVRSPTGPRSAYCVRLCDGRYFPIQGRRNFSAAEQCSSFCPTSKTKIFAGSAIEHATAADGQRYSDLPNAFVYRQRIVPDCSCDGRDRVGVARVPITHDPTLQPGDIVATNSGFTVYSGGKPQQHGALTPIESARVSESLRNRLADVKIAPQQPADSSPIPAARETTGFASSGGSAVSARSQ